jgi:hypothetical protein
MTFKIGDRVIAYDRYSKLKGKVAAFKGDLIGVKEYGEAEISFFHAKQCRKLKPKQRREWWINIRGIKKDEFEVLSGNVDLKNWFNNPDGCFFRTTPPPNKEGWIKVREVKE